MGSRHRETPYPVTPDVLYRSVKAYVLSKPEFYTDTVESGSRVLETRLMRNRLIYSCHVRFEVSERGNDSMLVIDLKTHPLFLDLLGFWERYLDRVTRNVLAELARG